MIAYYYYYYYYDFLLSFHIYGNMRKFKYKTLGEKNKF